MNKVLREKYEFSEQDANDMSDFLVPILDFVPEKRPTAAQCLNHLWIIGRPRDLSPTINSMSQATENGGLEKKREKDEREAMEAGVGKIVIDGTAKAVKVSQSVNPAKQS